MKWLIEVLVIGGIIWYVFSATKTPCVCEELPEDYFVIETRETETCIDENRKIHVTKITKQSKIDK